MGVSTRTYKDASGTSKTRLVGENGSSQDVGGVLLFDASGNVLVDRKAANASIPVVLSNEDYAAIDGLESVLANILTALGSVGGGVEYTEGDTDSTITGKAILWEDAGDTLTTVKASKPLPVVQTGTPVLPTGASTETTLAAILAKILTSPATEAKQDSIITHLGTIEGYTDGLEALLSRLPSGGAASDAGLVSIDGHVDGIEGLLTTLNSIVATQTTVAAILAKIIAAPATEAKQDTQITKLNGGLPAALGAGGGLKIDGSGTALPVSAASLPLPSGAATDAKLDTIITSLGNIDAGIPTALNQTTKSASMPVVLPSDYALPKFDFLEVTGSVTSATNVIAATDVGGYGHVSVHLTSVGSSTTTFEGSNDNTNWVSVYLHRADTTFNITTTSSLTGIFHGSIYYRYFRARVSSYSSGTVAATAEFRMFAPDRFPLTTSGMLNVGTNSTASLSTDGDSTNFSPADASSNLMRHIARGMMLNAAGTWDRVRNINALTVLTSAARTATVSTDVTNYNGRSFAVILNITAAPNTASTVTLQIRVKDSISGNYVTLLASAAILGSASQSPPYTNRYVVALGETVAANLTASEALGRTMNVNMVHSNADSWTYSVSVDIGL